MNLFSRVSNFPFQLRRLQQITMSLARGSASHSCRVIDETSPASWEFSGFSQNGEDGVIDLLSRHLTTANRYFVEIGASDGLENNTTWLALVRRFSGLWIEGSASSADWAKYTFTRLNYGLDIRSLFVDRESAGTVVSQALFADPDVLSVDIDGMDYHIVEALLDAGLRPKIIVVEYNSAFGPEAAVTIPYTREFRREAGAFGSLYYGCSITAWRRLLEHREYSFVTVEANGVNAFFVASSAFEQDFLANVVALPFAENVSQRLNFRAGWQAQLAHLSGKPFMEVS